MSGSPESVIRAMGMLVRMETTTVRLADWLVKQSLLVTPFAEELGFLQEWIEVCCEKDDASLDALSDSPPFLSSGEIQDDFLLIADGVVGVFSLMRSARRDDCAEDVIRMISHIDDTMAQTVLAIQRVLRKRGESRSENIPRLKELVSLN